MSIQIQHDNDTSTTESQKNTEGLPAPEHVPSRQTVVPSLYSGPTQRKHAIRIRLPRDPEKRAELPNDIHGVLVWVLADVCEESAIEGVEILIYPGPQGLEFVLHPRPFALDGRSDTQSELTWFDKALHSLALKKLKEAVKRRYPESITAEIGTLDLEPVGISDVTTTRLYKKKDARIPPSVNFKKKSLETLFTALRENHDPFIYQVIVDGEDGSYNLTVRLATYHPKDNYVGKRGFAKLVKRGKPTDLTRVFGRSNLVSNHDPSLVEKHWDVTYTEHISKSDTYTASYSYITANQYTSRTQVRMEADLLKAIVLGHKEHRRLLRGDTTVEPILKDEFNRYGRISTIESQLLPFVWTTRQRWETNPWRAVAGRDAPVFDSWEPIEIEGPGKFGIGPGMQDAPSEETTVINEGGPGHGALEQFTIRIFTEGGDEIVKVTQTTERLPDARIETADGMINTLGLQVDSDIAETEIEDENVTKGANTLVNAERAHAAGRHVIFVYDQEDVERGYRHLKDPYKAKLERGVKLYNGTETVKSLDGRELVRESDGPTTYSLEGETLIVKDKEGELTRGPANKDVAEFDWDRADPDSNSDSNTDTDEHSPTRCGYYVETDDGKHRIETADGEVIKEYASKKAFMADWTKIREPHLPIATSYLDFVTVTYRDKETHQLRVYDPRPDWETNDRVDSQKAGVKKFCEKHIVEREGAKLRYDELEEALRSWFEGRSQYDLPTRSVYAGYLPEELKEANTGATGNKYRYFDGYDLLFDPAIDSPYHPGPPADFEDEDPDTDASTGGES